MKKTSTSTETRSSSSESSHSSSSHSHGKSTPTRALQPGHPAEGGAPESLFQFSDWVPGRLGSVPSVPRRTRRPGLCSEKRTPLGALASALWGIFPGKPSWLSSPRSTSGERDCEWSTRHAISDQDDACTTVLRGQRHLSVWVGPVRFKLLTVSHRVLRGPPARVPGTVMIPVASPCGHCGFLRDMHPLNSDWSEKKRGGGLFSKRFCHEFYVWCILFSWERILTYFYFMVTYDDNLLLLIFF